MPETILFGCESLCIVAVPIGERIAAALQHRASLWSVDALIGDNVCEAQVPLLSQSVITIRHSRFALHGCAVCSADGDIGAP
jgi:hypothetical protein